MFPFHDLSAPTPFPARGAFYRLRSSPLRKRKRPMPSEHPHTARKRKKVPRLPPSCRSSEDTSSFGISLFPSCVARSAARYFEDDSLSLFLVCCTASGAASMVSDASLEPPPLTLHHLRPVRLSWPVHYFLRATVFPVLHLPRIEPFYFRIYFFSAHPCGYVGEFRFPYPRSRASGACALQEKGSNPFYSG